MAGNELIIKLLHYNKKKNGLYGKTIIDPYGTNYPDVKLEDLKIHTQDNYMNYTISWLEYKYNVRFFDGQKVFTVVYGWPQDIGLGQALNDSDVLNWFNYIIKEYKKNHEYTVFHKWLAIYEYLMYLDSKGILKFSPALEF